MLLFADGQTFGTIGGGSYEREALCDARKAIACGSTYFKEYHHIPTDEDPGLGCTFKAWLYVEIVRPAPTLVVCGGGHVGQSLLTLAKFTGFRTVLCDVCTTCAESGDADKVILCSSYKEGVLSPDIPDGAYYFCGAGRHTEDKEALEGILQRPFAYAGMLGSVKKAKEVLSQLADMGYDAALLTRIHAPVGLDICDMSPKEVAMSVMAEILMVKNNKTGLSRKVKTNS
jgi:xanthine dehydrogenase accessory factor